MARPGFRGGKYTPEMIEEIAQAHAVARDTVAEWLDLMRQVAEDERRAHPPIVDRFGRVWYWKRSDLYTHDGSLALPMSWLLDGRVGLPRPGPADDNPNYRQLCAICRRGTTNELTAG